GSNRQLVIRFEGIDEVNAFRQYFSSYAPKKSQHADMAGFHARHGCEQRDHDQKREHSEPQQFYCYTSSWAYVDHLSSNGIINSHKMSSAKIVKIVGRR